jgi:hypothetical protein
MWEPSRCFYPYNEAMGEGLTGFRAKDCFERVGLLTQQNNSDIFFHPFSAKYAEMDGARQQFLSAGSIVWSGFGTWGARAIHVPF